jgi:RNA polymerase sigma-70 factor (ECF subfamily)
VTPTTSRDRSVTRPAGTVWHDPAVTDPPVAAGGATAGSTVRRSRLSELTDDELVQRAQSGNSRAFETLLRRHERAMFGTALRLLGRPGDAEDAVQEAFIAAWRRLPEFRGDAKFSTWLYRIVTNRSLNELRRRKPAASLDDEDDGPVPAALVLTGGPERQAEQSALVAALQSALAGLPEPLRVCWLLREVDRRSYDEIAAIVGIPEPTVRGRIARARTRLAEVMSPWR